MGACTLDVFAVPRLSCILNCSDGDVGVACEQLQVVLAAIVGRFEVRLADHMGGWQGCMDKSINIVTRLIVGGSWLQFTPRVPQPV